MSENPVSYEATAVFDLGSYEDVTQADVAIKDPLTGAPTSFVVTLAGPEHAISRKISLNRARRARAEFQKRNKIVLNDPEEEEIEVLDELVDRTLGWKGVNVPFSPQAVREAYTSKAWLRAQVRAALDEREHFIRRSAAR